MNTREQIVVFDREPDWCGFLAQVLRGAGYTVTARCEIPSTFREVPPPTSILVVVDAALKTLIRELATEHADLRFVVFTASPSVSEAIEAYRQGASDYETKAFDSEAILGTIRTALGRQPVRSPRFVL
jgi:DNA-binding NtrC family response regulator